MSVETTYTLQGLDGGIASLSVASSTSPNPDADLLDFGLFRIGYSVSGEQEGVIEVDLASGLSSSRLTQTLSGEMILITEDDQITLPLSAETLIQTDFIREK